MKKWVLASLLSLFNISAMAHTVSQAKHMRDNQDVTLTGKIVKYLGDENYLFKDNTGQIVIEVDDDDDERLRHYTGTVMLVGEIDRNDSRVKIDVDSVRKR